MEECWISAIPFFIGIIYIVISIPLSAMLTEWILGDIDFFFVVIFITIIFVINIWLTGYVLILIT